ncbi:MAG: hypothetical protein J3Q66DRAFT_339074 [Benniella sp.]|nr:MAG: hypothetical protein J3Q66DRAFT_339074 [Benniella sp.]
MDAFGLTFLTPATWHAGALQEDISTEKVREKYEVFRNYYNSGSYLQPASMYSIIFRDGIMTIIPFQPTEHHLNVLRRLEQLQSHITLTPVDQLCAHGRHYRRLLLSNSHHRIRGRLD